MTTYAEILSLVDSHGVAVDLSDNAASLSVTEAQALATLGVTFAATDKVVVTDTAAHMEALDAAALSALDAMGVTSLVATDRALALNLDQSRALAAGDISASSRYETLSATTANDISLAGLGDGGRIVTLDDGSLVVFYMAYSDYGYSLYSQRLDREGAASGSAVMVSGAMNVTQFNVTSLTNGGYAVSWFESSPYSGYVQTFGSDGAAAPPATFMSGSNGYQPSVTALSDGGHMVTWFANDGSNYVLYAQRYTAMGAAAGSTTALESSFYSASSDKIGAQDYSVVELTSGKIAVIWTGNTGGGGREVRAQILDENGAANGGVISVNTAAVSGQIVTVATALSDGGFAVVWTRDTDIYLQRFDVSGDPQGSETLVNTITDALQAKPRVTALEGGGFVVVWQSNVLVNGSYANDVHMQMYDASGAAIGGETLVNTTVAGEQNSPEVVALADGGYVVVWRDASSGQYLLKGQIFEADGDKVGGEFSVVASPDSNPWLVTKIVALEDGGFAITYTDNAQLYTRVYQNDTEKAHVSVTAAELSNLTAADAADFQELGITSIVVSDNGAVVLGKDTAVALSGVSDLELSGPSSVSVRDTGANVDDLTPSEIKALSNLGVKRLDVSDDAVSLTLAQAQALVTEGMSFASEDQVTITLSAAELKNLDKIEMSALVALGADVIDLTEAASLSVAAAQALRSAGLALAADDTVTLVDQGGAFRALSAADITALAALGVDKVDLADNAVSLSAPAAQAMAAAGLKFAANDVVTVSSTAAELLALEASDLSALSGIGVSRLVLVDTAAMIEGLSAAEIASLASMGVTSLLATDRAIALDLDQTEALAAADISISSRYETLSPATPTANYISTTSSEVIAEVIELSNGSLVAVSLTPNSDGIIEIIAQRVDVNGALIGEAVTLVAGVIDNQTKYFDVAALANGGYAVSWRTNLPSSVSTQVFNADGVAVSEVNTVAASGGQMPKIAALSDGGYLMTWLSKTDIGYALNAQRFDASGATVGPASMLEGKFYEETFADPLFKQISINELSNGDTLILWRIEGSHASSVLKAQIFHDTGSAASPAFSIDGSVYKTQSDPTVAVLSGGAFVVSWYDWNANVNFQLYSETGEALGSKIVVTSYVYGWSAEPAITALSNGGFVVTWSYPGDGDQKNVMMQVFDAFGAATGPATLVKASVAGDQTSPTLVALEGGGFVVIWNELVGNSFSVRAQVFDEAGSKIGSEIPISAGLSSANLLGIEALDDGGFLVVLRGWRRVYTRVFDVDTEIPYASVAASELASLSVSDIADMHELGIARIVVSDSGAVRIGKEAALSLSALSDLSLSGASSITVFGEGVSLDDLSASELSALATLGVTGLDATDDSVTLSLVQANALIAEGMRFASDDAVTIRLTAADLQSLSSADLTDLAALGAETLDLTNAASISYARALEISAAGFSFASDDVVTLVDEGSSIEDLSASEIAALVTLGVDSIDLTDNSVNLLLATAKALATSGLAFASDDEVTTYATAAQISALTVDEIKAIAGIGVSRIFLSDASDVNISILQAQTLTAEGVDLGIKGFDVSVVATGAEISALDASDFAAFAALGVTRLDASDGAVSLTFPQIEALSTLGIPVASGDTLSLLATAAEFSSLTAANLAKVGAYGVTTIASTSSVLDATIAQTAAMKTAGLSFTDSPTVRLSDTLSRILALPSADIGDYKTLGVDLLRVSDTGAVLAAMTTTNINTLKTLGVYGLNATDGAVTISLAKANTLALADIVFDSDNAVAVSATAATFADPDTLDLPGLAAINVDRIDVSDDVITLGYGAAKPYVDAGIGFTEADTVTVTLSYAQAMALTKTVGASLRAANVDALKVTMTGGQLAGLSASSIAALGAKGVNVIDLSDDKASLTAAQIGALVDGGVSLTSPDALALVDAAANIAALTPTEISAHAALGVASVDASDDALSLSLSQAQALVNAKIALTAADAVTVTLTYAEAASLTTSQGSALLAAKVDTLKVEMTGGELMDLSASAIRALANKGASVFDLSDDFASLTAAQMAALADAHISLVAPDATQLVDTGAHIAALTTAQIADFAALGLTAVNASDDALTLSLTTAQALLDAKIALTAANAVTVRLTSTEASALSKSDAQALFAAHVDTLAVEMTGSDLAGLSAGAISALADKGVSVFDLSDNAASLTAAQVTALADGDIRFTSPDALALVDTGAVIAGLSTATIAAYAQLGVTAINASDDAITLSLAKAQALLDRKVALTAADAVTVSLSYAEANALSASQAAALKAANVDTIEAVMTGAQTKALTTSHIAALGARGIDEIDLSNNAVLLTSAQSKAFAAAGIDFASDDKISVHAAPKLVADSVTVAENKTAKVSVLSNDTVFDGYDLSVTKAEISSGKGVATIGKDGTLSVRYAGPDIDGSAKAVVKVTYTATDGVETSRSTLTVTFTAVTEPLIGTAKADKINGGSWDDVIKGLGGNDILHGNGGADKIYGGDGADRLFGDAGNDLLKGDAGNDRLDGGAGVDKLYGGSGADVFVFSKLSDLGKTKATADAVMDFRHSQHDIIDLSDIDANSKRSGNQDFDFIGSDKYSKTAGELRIDGDKSAYFLHGDVNGDGKDDFIIEIHSTTKLVKSDFDL